MKNLRSTLNIIMKSIKFLFNVSRPLFIITLVLISISGICTSVKLFVWGHFIDLITRVFEGNKNYVNNIFFILFLHLGISIVQIIISQVSLYIQNIFSKYVDREMTEQTLKKVEDFGLIDFDDSGFYNIIHKVSDESHSRSMSIMNTLIQIVQAISTCVGTVVLLIQFHVYIVLLCVFSSIPLFLVSNRIMDKWFEIFNQRFERVRFAKFLKSMCIKYDNIKELKVFQTNQLLRNKIMKIYNDNISEDKKIRKIFLKEMSLINFLDLIFGYLIKILIIILSISKEITVGSLIIYIQAVDILKESTNNLMSLCSQAYEDSLYMKYFFSLMQIKKNKDSKIEFNKGFKKIEFVDVSFKYANTDTYAVKHFSYSFENSNVYAFVGINGSGKTTILKLLLGLYELQEGQILIDGVDLNYINKESYYKQISAIFQDFIKYPFTVGMNMTVADWEREYSIEEIDKVAHFTGAYEFINTLSKGYDTQLQKEWSESVELSLGQWQKIAVSRAALKESAILVLDEPTASIDAITEAGIFKNIREIATDKMCVIVTHRLSNIKIANRILVFEDGCLLEAGTHDELILSEKLYAKLFNLQAEAYK